MFLWAWADVLYRLSKLPLSRPFPFSLGMKNLPARAHTPICSLLPRRGGGKICVWDFSSSFSSTARPSPGQPRNLTSLKQIVPEHVSSSLYPKIRAASFLAHTHTHIRRANISVVEISSRLERRGAIPRVVSLHVQCYYAQKGFAYTVHR